MKPKTMILMGLAITCGLGASYMTSRLLAERSPAEEEKVKILVAKKNLNVGQRISDPEELFEYKEVSKDSEPPDAIKDFDAIKGKSLKQNRNKGEWVTAANLRGAGEQLKLPEGHFAQGLKVTLEGTASGFATLPGSRVNIIQTVTRGSNYSQILLSDVLVLAADLKLDSTGELASPAQVVTFALSGKDVLKVNLAKELGILSLALRNPDDHSHDDAQVVYVKDIQPDRKERKEIPEEVVVPQPPPKVAEVKPEIKPEIKDDPVLPKVVTGYYDIVAGTVSGVREVRRVYWKQTDDGPIEIERTELIESTRSQNASPGNAPKKGGQRDF
jgi:pilus assembly protein CpaB